MDSFPLNGNRLDETTATLCREIRTLMEKGDAAGEEFYKAAGQRIKELKGLYPGQWLVLIRQECGIGRSRAFQLIAIGDGTKTLEETRAQTAARVKRSAGRRKNPLASGQAGSVDTVSASSSDEAIGKFLEELGGRVFQVLRHAPALSAEITKRVLALHERKVTPLAASADAVASPNADSSNQTNVLDSIKQSKAVAEAYRKILKVTPFDREAKKQISDEIESLIRKLRSVQSTLAGDTDTKAAAPTTDFAAAMARAEFAEAKRKGTKPRSSKQIEPKLPVPPKLDALRARSALVRATTEAPTKH